MGRTPLLLGSLILLCASLAPAQGGQTPPPSPPPELHWTTSVTDAFTRAKAEKKPVLWVIMKDGEIACQRMLEKVYADPQVITRCADFVLLPCSTYLHPKKNIFHDGKEMESCPQFRGVSCAEHQAIEREMRARYESVEEVVAPQHIVCDAEGKVLERKRYEMSTSMLLAFLDRGLRLSRGEPPPPEPAKGAGDPPSGDPPPPPAPGATPELSAEGRRLVSLLLTAPEEERLQAAKDLAEGGDSLRVKALVDTLLGPDLKPEALKLRIIRALGSQDYGAAAPEFKRLLEIKSTSLRNGAVVTLEEMANTAVADALLELWKKEKDPEIRKDLLRALGPCGVGKAPARTLLIDELRGRDEPLRVASAMALGHHLSGSDEVRSAIKDRWKKDASDKLKIAILFAFSVAKDPALAGDIDELLATERNNEIKSLGLIIKNQLGGGLAGGAGRGGGGGPGGRGGARGGPQVQIFRAFSRLFGDDKVERNIVRDFRERFGNRGR